VRALPRDLRPCVIVAYLTGWRMVSELLTRQWRHVDMGARWLRLEPGEGKTGEGRQFPLFPELALVLRAQRRATNREERRLERLIPWIFHHTGAPLFYRAKNGTLLPSAYLRESWLAACTAAGIDGRLRHDFRRTAARDMLRAGVSVPTVMRAIGWRSEAMLRRYAIVSDGDLQGGRGETGSAAPLTSPRVRGLTRVLPSRERARGMVRRRLRATLNKLGTGGGTWGR